MFNERSFDFGGRETVTTDVNNVVNTATDPVVTFVVTTCSITSELGLLAIRNIEATAKIPRITHVVVRVHVQVCIHVSLVRTPDSTGHAGPWLLESQHALDIITVDLLARNRVDNGWLDTEEWKGGTSWLGGGHTSERSDNVGTGLGLPVCLECTINYKFLRYLCFSQRIKKALTSTT